jgi:hypothetical protein
VDCGGAKGGGGVSLLRLDQTVGGAPEAWTRRRIPGRSRRMAAGGRELKVDRLSVVAALFWWSRRPASRRLIETGLWHQQERHSGGNSPGTGWRRGDNDELGLV